MPFLTFVKGNYFNKPSNPVNSERFKLELLSASNTLKLSATVPIATVVLMAASLLVSNNVKRLEICFTVELELNEPNNVAAVERFDVFAFLRLSQLNIVATTAKDKMIFFIL